MASQTLSLSQTQQLQMVLAPQLRQSLEMLQLPIMELRTMIQQELEQNPTIEEIPIETPNVEIGDSATAPDQKAELDFDKEFEVLSKLDNEWRDYFFQDAAGSHYSPEAEEKRQYMFDSLPQKESLQQHLMDQLALTGLKAEDAQAGELIIGSITDDGYLTTPLEELAASANFEVDRLRDILATIQDFHPTGVGARDLRECLLIQLERLGRADSIAGEIVRSHLDKLAGHKLPDLAKALKVPVEEIQQATRFIATLEPKPGRIYASDSPAYVLPEVVVQKVDGEYVLILNDDQLPRIRISNQYRTLLADPSTTDKVKSYIRERIRAGAFLIKSIHQRQRTIHRIAGEIIRTQHDFLEHGISQLKPMTMAEVASIVGVHETTVSRAVSGKYMQTPIGMFDMKYFFTPGIKTADGHEVSNMVVKDKIANMIAEEEPDKPLSDQEILERLGKEGINIARRTIAKYRLVLGIGSSHRRKLY